MVLNYVDGNLLMAKTLLRMTQDVLESIDGEEVNSISDTIEASSVAGIIEACYDSLVLTGDFRETKKPFTLTAMGTGKPVLMGRPDNVVSIEWIKYDIREDGDPYPSWSDIQYLSIEDFLQITLMLPSESTADIGSFVHNIEGSNVSFFYRTDGPPKYFTTIDDTYILFDSYDIGIDANLQESKTMCFGQVDFTFLKQDSFVIPFDKKTTKQLLEESKARCSIELRQTQNPAAEKVARRLHVRSQFDNRQIGRRDSYEDRKGYGRK